MEILYYLQDEPRNLGLICNSSEIQLVFPGKKHLAFHFELQRELLSRSSWPRSQIHADLNSLNHRNQKEKENKYRSILVSLEHGEDKVRMNADLPFQINYCKKFINV